MLSKNLVCLALAALAAAQSEVLSFTSVPNPVTDGQPQAITYQTNDTVTPVTIILRQGLATNLQTLYNITTSATGGSYIWTPRTDLPNGNDYALQISQGNQTNYYGPFRVQGYIGPLSSSSASASATSSQSNSITSVGALSTGTGSAIPRNTTFSSATLSSTSTVATTSTVVVTTATSASPSASRTGAANANAQIGSSLALVGALAALMMH